jgi:hypothetical protein
MNQLLLRLAASALAAAAFAPTAGYAVPILLFDRHEGSRLMFAGGETDRFGAAVPPCLAPEMDVLNPDRNAADNAEVDAGTADTLVWLVLTCSAALLAFVRRSPAAHARTRMPGT